MAKVYYHYTTNDGAEGIFQSQVILKSVRRGSGRRDDVRFGEGVYLTTVAPSQGKKFVAYNNYDGRQQSAIMRHIQQGRVDWCIKLVLDPKDVDVCSTGDGRDVHRYHSGDLHLTPQTQWEIIEVEKL